MFKIKIVTYEAGVGSYRSFNDITFDNETEALREAMRLRSLTGKCYGVFGPAGREHDTSPYYGALNLKEEV